ncbi:MAG TPA: terminase [Anaeromyxobacteraceae bacterium]|nr:terminase [Anaeromyxobacteraceae bacterium]
MDPTREGGLLAWQFRNYPTGHRNRRNLALHVATAPIFVAGTCALVLAPLAGIWLLVFAVPAVVLPLVVQGRGHRLEANPPSPFLGSGDFAARFFAEQWVTFPRYVLSGGFARAWREAGARSRLERSRVT